MRRFVTLSMMLVDRQSHMPPSKSHPTDVKPTLDAVDRFLCAVRENPAHLAVFHDSGQPSFAQLEEQVRRFATAFQTGDEPRVLIALPQGADAYAAMLAAGLSGGYYTPLNTAAPVAKLRRIAAQLQPTVIIADDPTLASELAQEAPLAKLIDPATAKQSKPFDGRGTRHGLAYVIFTSGSTGTPKGVMIPRTALDHYVDWAAGAIPMHPGDRVSQHPNIAFDVSVLEIYGALGSGATLCPLVSAGERLMPARTIDNTGITVWVSVPSVVSLMAQARQINANLLRSVRLFGFCGEPLLPTHLDALFAARPDADVINLYGPTEATVSMTAMNLNSQNYRDACRATVSIGGPIAGMGLHLVGGSHPDEGELVITGPQLAVGYWKDEARTAQAFRQFELDGVSLRGYFTGDWSERVDGRIYFKDRLDFQVKVHGYRLELDEVAAAIRDCGWPAVCVVKWNDAVAAVVEQIDGKDFDEAALQAALASRIEPYAIPTVIRAVRRIPRNDNDKLDRNAVVAWLNAEQAAAGPAPAPPKQRTST